MTTRRHQSLARRLAAQPARDVDGDARQVAALPGVIDLLERRTARDAPPDDLDVFERYYDEARLVWNANLPTVRTAQLLATYSVIDQVMASARRDGDRLRGSVVIDAPPGLGKTTIATRYARLPPTCLPP